MRLQDIKDKRSYNRNCIVPRLREIRATDIAVQIEQCSQISQVATCSDCGTKYYNGTSYCKSRYCAVCSRLRALAWLSKLVPLLEEYRNSGYKIYMLNLTVKNGENLSDIIDKLMQAWRIMTHDDKQCRKEFRQLNHGGVRSIEIKVGKLNKMWHPHIHSIVILKTASHVKQYEQYRSIWEHSTSLAYKTTDKVGSVDIRGLKGYNGDIIRAVVETFKYMTKLDWLNMPNEQLVEMISTTKGRRFISSWGDLYGISRQVDELLSKTTEDELTARTCEICGCSQFELETILTDMLPESIREFKTDITT